MSRYDYYQYFKPSQPRPTEQGIKAKSKRGDFAKNWWANRWIEALEQVIDAGRLRRGKRYARQGQVLKIEEAGQGIEAKVQGSRARPYNITIKLTHLSDDQWATVVAAMAEQAIFTAQLLAGEMPQEIEPVFEAAGVSLFPSKSGELETDCSCPDWANPCKHLAAVHYILGEQFDEDPFLLFRLRGRTQEEIMAALRAQRTEAEGEEEAGEAGPTTQPLTAAGPEFWEMAQPLDHFQTQIKPPLTPYPILKRLGQPTFLSEDLISTLGPVYQAITEAALKTAFADDQSGQTADDEQIAMELSEILYQYTNEVLNQYAQFCKGCYGATRKDDLVACIHRYLMTPESLKKAWNQLDTLSQKALAAAFHNDGEFNAVAFQAQYGQLPPRPKSRYFWQRTLIPLDLFLHQSRLPTDLRPLLADLVPPPERFQLEGHADVPSPTIIGRNATYIPLVQAETEEAGLHDLTSYLHLVSQGELTVTANRGDLTLASVKKLIGGLLEEDFLPLPDKFKAKDTIRPTGLDSFAQQAGLVKRRQNSLELTQAGQRFYQTRDPETLLEAFETWTHEGRFDELSRLTALKGQTSRAASLTPPAPRRQQIIEALSWCPVDVWIDLQQFYRALKIWHFDFEVETGAYSNLYIGAKSYNQLHNENYWSMVKGMYINVVLWEYLGSLGALDLLYTQPEEVNLAPTHNFNYVDDSYYSLYDGLRYFRINKLGAFLLGQADEYETDHLLDQPLFTISPERVVSFLDPEAVTPADHLQLVLVAVPLDDGTYRLDTTQLLTSLEEGADWQHLLDFLHQRHAGPLPPAVIEWLETLQQNSRAFQRGPKALFIKVKSAELMDLALDDRVLGKFCQRLDAKTLVIPASKEKKLRQRLKTLSYMLAE